MRIFLLSLLLALLASCGKPDRAAAGAASAPAAAKAPVLLISPEDLLTLAPATLASGPVVTGSVQPERNADLRAELATVVTAVYKDNGQSVNSGDLLLRLDDTAIRDSLASAEEALRASTQAQDQAERQLQRLKTLQAQGMVSMQSLEDAEVRRINAQSDLVAAKSRVVTARQQMQRTNVRAPFAGVVADRKVSVGDTVQVGRELLKVIDPNSMRFEGLVSADYMSTMKIGQPVSFRVNGFGDTEFAGKVSRIDAAANPTTRQVAVIIAFDKSAAAPRVSGLFAEGRIQTGSSQALMLPASAIVRAREQAHVWRVDGQAVQRVSVRLGDRDPRSGDFPLLQGLAAGDRVLAQPGSNLVDGQKFDLAQVTKPAPAALVNPK